MAIVHIRSLPFDPPIDVAALLRRLNADLAEHLNVPVGSISATWQTVAPGHYAVGAEAPGEQPADTHPLLADLVLHADIETAATAELMALVAETLAERARVGTDNVLVRVWRLASGDAWECGRPRHW